MKRLVRVGGESMAPSYRQFDLLLTRAVGRDTVLPRGAVVVFRHGGARMLKRVVGVPGDHVELEAGRLFVNGRSVDGRPRVPGASIQAWRVPKGGYFVAGDNAGASDDSRVWDEPFVPVGDVEAVVIQRVAGARRCRAPWTRRLLPAAPDPAEWSIHRPGPAAMSPSPVGQHSSSAMRASFQSRGRG